MLSVSVCRIVPGYTEPVSLVTDRDSLKCIGMFVDYLTVVAKKAKLLNSKKWKSTLAELETRIAESTAIKTRASVIPARTHSEQTFVE